MAESKLEGWTFILRWDDFKGGVPPHRSPGDDAFTKADYQVAVDTTWRANGRKTIFQIGAVRIRVTLDRNAMWSVRDRRTSSLLKHEQGHYDIVALAMRDLFHDLVGLQSKEFSSEDLLKDAIALSQQPLVDYIKRLESNESRDGLYDASTGHGTHAGSQEKWNNAFSKARQSGTRLADAIKAWVASP